MKQKIDRLFWYPRQYHSCLATGILPSQRSIAEITELIYTAELIHQSVVDIPSTQPAVSSGGYTDSHHEMAGDQAEYMMSSKMVDNLKFGNKLAILIGDFLLANASVGLGKLNCTEVICLFLDCKAHECC